MTVPAQGQTLEQRITARLHESIGDLITEEDLKAMVAAGINRALYEPRVTTNTGGYSTQVKTEPSIVDALVRQLLEARMRDAVEAWLKANPERIEEAVKEAVGKGAGACMIAWMDSRMASIFEYGVTNLRNQGLLPRGPG